MKKLSLMFVCLCAFSCIASACFLFLFLGSIPGLHFDEAWVIQTVRQMNDMGYRPVSGMNSYTGALHFYLLWPLFNLFGYNAAVLRTFSVVLNALTAFGMFILVRNVASPLVAGGVIAFLITSPAFVAFSRFGVEVTTVVPFLLVWGVVLIMGSQQSSSSANGESKVRFKTLGIAAAGGALIGLASHSHAIALAFPISFGITLVFFRWQNYPAIMPGQNLRATIVGFIVGFLPRLLTSVNRGAASQWKGQLTDTINLGFMDDLFSLPGVLSDILNGGLIYQRFTGENFVYVLPYATLSLAIVILSRISVLRKSNLSPAEIVLCSMCVLVPLIMLAMSPRMSPRFFLFFAWLVPLTAGMMSMHVFAHGSASLRRYLSLAWAVSVVFNVCYVGLDYFLAFASHGGKVGVFKVGQRLLETGNHFISTEALYRQLIDKGVSTVIAKEAISLPLAIHDMEYRRLHVITAGLGDRPEPPPGSAGGTAYVYYNGPEVWRQQAWDFREIEKFALGTAGGLVFARDPGFDPHFLVYREIKQ